MPKQIQNRFAEHLAIKERQEKRRITHRDIVKETNISKSTVGSYLRNEVQRPDLEVVAILCDYLGITVWDFFTEVEGADEPKQLEAPLLATA